MKKILFSLIAILVCVGLVGGAFAWFSDTDTSTGNTFTAGTLDLEMRTAGGPGVPATSWSYDHSGPIAYAQNMAPGVEAGPFDVRFRNGGTMDGYVDVNFSYSDYDDPSPYGEFATPTVSGKAYAQKLVVTRAYMDGGPENKAPYWAEQCINSHSGDPDPEQSAVDAGEVVAATTTGPVQYLPTVYGLSTITLEFWFGGNEVVWHPTNMHYETFYLALDSSAGNAYAFDGVSVTLSATINQVDAP
jgi:predicted ribosomally synthesized peptide with SipW-like signal peptide